MAGRDVARIGLGTNRLTATADNERFLREAVDAGLGHIDTAHVYTGGDSERAIGAALSPKPDGTHDRDEGRLQRERQPRGARAQIEQSLESLRAEAIDLYYLHRVDPEAPLEESLGAIGVPRRREDPARRDLRGDVEQIEAARRVVPIAAVQNHYNLADRELRRRGRLLRGERHRLRPVLPAEEARAGRARGRRRAPRRDADQITLAWLLRRSPAILPIPGTLSIEHLRENLGALEIELTDDDFDQLGG